MGFKVGCLICGEELEYLEEVEYMTCSLCGLVSESNVRCMGGHYVCDSCHSLPANDLIREHCTSSSSTDPLEMALEIMRDPRVKMHGPEHHFLVPAVLLSAYYNHRGDSKRKETKIRQAQRRAEKILGGFCGFYGDCGAAVGTGIFVSLITDSNPLSVDGWRLSNMITGRNLLKIAEYGGPRCCKRNTFFAILGAVEFLEEEFGLKLDVDSETVCEFSDLNKECRFDACPFHGT
jgi:hypothetical protein